MITLVGTQSAGKKKKQYQKQIPLNHTKRCRGSNLNKNKGVGIARACNQKKYLKIIILEQRTNKLQIFKKKSNELKMTNRDQVQVGVTETEPENTD